MRTFIPEICHEPTQPSDQELSVVNVEIQKLEQQQNLEDDLDRWRQASLFIDYQFIATEALRGRKRGFERLFGHIEWEGYLRAKQFADEQDCTHMTPEFLLGIHREFLARQAPQVAGTYATGDYRAIMRGTNGDILPVQYSDSEMAQIQANPYLDFESVGEDSNRGFMYYRSRSQKDHETAIGEVCDWYNDTETRQLHPVVKAAKFGRMLISRHAYAFGINGRHMRVAMNKSLVMDNWEPCALFNFNNDLLTPEEQWIDDVAEGCERYYLLGMMKPIFPGDVIIDPVDFFGARVYTANASSMDKISSLPQLEPGWQFNRGRAEKALDTMRATMSWVFDFMPDIVGVAGYPHIARQLIADEFSTHKTSESRLLLGLEDRFSETTLIALEPEVLRLTHLLTYKFGCTSKADWVEKRGWISQDPEFGHCLATILVSLARDDLSL